MMLLRLLLVVLALGGLAQAADDAEVIVISPHWQGIQDETSRAFRAWHLARYGQPATIRWRHSGGGSQIVKFLGNEYLSGPSAGIDVLYGGGVDPFRELEKDGLLARCDLPGDLLAALPAQLNGMDLRDPGQAWFGAALSGFGILTNERARAAVGLPVVRRWSDLADPRLAGWISGADPRASGSALAIYEIILQSLGWDQGWSVLLRMGGNTRNFLSSSAGSAVEIGVGDAVYGVAIDSYGQAQAAYYGPDNVSFILPEGQTVITPDAIAVLKNPPHPEMARRFLEFVLSREGQLLWMLPKGAPGGAKQAVINRMSVLPALYLDLAGVTPVKTNPFQTPSSFVYSQQLGSRRRALLSLLLAAWLIDSHDDLVTAWKALQSPPYFHLPEARRQALLARFLAPPCTAAELDRAIGPAQADPIRRAALVNGWQNEALRRYSSVAREIAVQP